jgi:hypothetical protein
MTSQTSWPPTLRTWLQNSLSGLTLKQTQQAQVELKQVIQDILPLVNTIKWEKQKPHRLADVKGTVASLKSLLQDETVVKAMPYSNNTSNTVSTSVENYSKQKVYQQPSYSPLNIKTNQSYSTQEELTNSISKRPKTGFSSIPPSYTPQGDSTSFPVHTYPVTQYPPTFVQDRKRSHLEHNQYESLPPPPLEQHKYGPPILGKVSQYNSYPAPNVNSYLPPQTFKVSQYHPIKPVAEIKKPSVNKDEEMLTALRDFYTLKNVTKLTHSKLEEEFLPSYSGYTKKDLVRLCSLENSGLTYTKKHILLSTIVKDEDEILNARALRFQPSSLHYTKTQPYPLDNVPIGTCLELEKSFLRSSACDLPDPSLIRPQAVLEQALKGIITKTTSKSSYDWANDQLKAIRQDLKYQNINNEFMVIVYETHVRLAIEFGGPDYNELNTCLTQLKEVNQLNAENNLYFLLYHVYCVVRYHSKTSKIVLALFNVSDELQTEALKIYFSLSNWVEFFTRCQTFENTSRLGKLILDSILDVVRVEALRKICITTPKQIPLTLLNNLLFLNDERCRKKFKAKFPVIQLMQDQLNLANTKGSLELIDVIIENDEFLWG